MTDDYINRQAVHDLIAELLSDYLHDEDREKIEELDVKIEDLTPVTPNEKTGHWVNAKVGKLFPSNDYKCSECGNLLDFDGVNCGRGDVNYCPNCGCHMVESQESKDKEVKA